jgi:glyoxylase-like metal-dependent hydrolase (beta-lactamase superfamily II)
MGQKSFTTIDLEFMGRPGTIASYLLPHRSGAALVECGPGSTLEALQAGLRAHGYTPGDISDVFLTHIHLDHAGAAGWLSRQGARIHVHPVGAPHLLDPEKLLTSAQRIYGEHMQRLWGEFLPVLPDRLSILSDNQTIEIEELRLRTVDTPGHAEHHFAYIFDDVCFSGDIGGVRMHGFQHLRLPMPPPEFHLEKWRQSIKRLQAETFQYIAPTHFGLFSDPQRHLAALWQALDEIEAWMEAVMPANPDFESLNLGFLKWTEQRSLAAGLTVEQLQAYELANPSWMSTYGIQRYWRKQRQPG